MNRNMPLGATPTARQADTHSRVASASLQMPLRPGEASNTIDVAHRTTYGPLGRLGLWTGRHVRVVLLGWAAVVVVLGLFAPRAETSLAGAGWEASGSESVAARQIVQRDFQGLSSAALQVVVQVPTGSIESGAGAAVVQRATDILRADSHVSTIVPPTVGVSISPDGRTGVIQAGAANADTNEMVLAADDLKATLTALSSKDATVELTGSSALWGDFNAANRSAMLKSELMSWPVTLAILVLAFGSLVAAGLPLMLTITGLTAAAGSLYLTSRLGDVSIWAMNFALMFALALGIDYALFIVVRFRAALRRQPEEAGLAVAETMDTAGKAVLFSGLTVLISLSAVMLVPSPAFRSTALGIMFADVFVLAATLTLLPAVLVRLGGRVNALAVPGVRVSDGASPRFAAWGRRLWNRPLAYGAVALAILVALALPVLGMRTAMPSIKVVPSSDTSRVGYEELTAAFGPGAPGTLQLVVPAGSATVASATLRSDPGIAHVTAPMPGSGEQVLIQAQPATAPSDPAVGRLIDRLRGELPAGSLVGGTAAENHDLEAVLASTTLPVIGVILVLGFLLLLVVLQAPLAAALGVLTSLLSTGAAFGVARLVFQDGRGSGLFGFAPQGFLDAWAPIFFFAMIFAIAMDYTVFLLASVKEHWERTGDAHDAMVAGVAHSGRVIFAAAGVMVAVFFTFAMSGPLPPKEMGAILGVAVLLDAALVRLVLLPVLLRLAGSAAWASPAWLRRLLPNVRFSH
ncbi:MMPL family transporter [Cellulomonas sp. McL0617]|uniref:MMPL family transporter n=1 Tax=Cellulomonas sp. McL0617 TaxID=3415675 RepID=UPI003CEF8343